MWDEDGCTHYISLHQVAMRENVTLANDRAFETSIMYKTTLDFTHSEKFELWNNQKIDKTITTRAGCEYSTEDSNINI